MNTADREALRIVATLIALHAIIGKHHGRNPQMVEEIASGAVAYADALLNNLDEPR